MKTIQIKPGIEVLYKGERYYVTRLLDLNNVMAEDAKGGLARLEIKDIEPLLDQKISESVKSSLELLAVTDDQWLVAQERFALIKPILENPGDGKLLNDIAKKSNLNRTTLYRWVERYQSTSLVSSLVAKERSGGKGKSRLSEEVEFILKDTIKSEYLTRDRHKIGHTIIEVINRCKNAKLKPPHPNTIRNRIMELSEESRMKARYGSKISDQKFKQIEGEFPGADYPLSVVQIDHTKVDILLVDEDTREVLGKPWLTIGIDVYSRLVTGFHVSLDPPGAMGTGICLSNSILPKEKKLAEFNIKGEWQSWGIMRTIHADNAGEFKGNMIKRICEEYGITMNWRLVARPNYGGHIERLMGTLKELVHNLPGTTFSNTQEKSNYDSAAKATFSLREFEEILLIYITEIYHKRFHTGINNTPIAKYSEGIFGSKDKPGIGYPTRVLDERKVRLDFMPFFKRTIQEYGVKIDHIDYYHDVLRKWIHAVDAKSGKHKIKKEFIFKRDPRDISIIYFWDPELKDYFEIPYRIISRPSISIWEFRKALRAVKEAGRQNVDEESIFKAYERIQEIKREANRKKLSAQKSKKIEKPKSETKKSIHSNYKSSASVSEVEDIDSYSDIKPFEDLDNGTSI